MRFRSAVLRYLIAVGVFVSLVLTPVISQRLIGVTFETTFLIILAMVACAWYLGRGPGLVIALLFEAVLVYFSWPGFTVRAVLVTFNRLLLFTGVVWFASSRRVAENKLRDQKELVEVTLASIGDAVIATDINGRVTFLNPVAQTLTGWTAAEAIGQPLDKIFQLVNETTREPIDGPFEKIREGDTAFGVRDHTMLVTKNGLEVPIDDSGAAITDASGNVVGAVIVFQDVTERRAAQAEREKLLVSERASRIEAERANRLKDEFLAVVSHELRTPLNAILGWSSILKQTDGSRDDLLNGLTIIERNARSQNRIISDILDVSRIASEKLVVDLRPVDLSLLVQDVVDSLLPEAVEKYISLTTDTLPTGIIVSGDTGRLHQVFSNLISNAIKFTPTDGSVRVALSHSDHDATVSITDTGIGIPSDLLDEIFDRFRQADSSIKRERGGLGLGLAIVRHIVELHGGTVDAVSEGHARGSTFNVSLPLLVASRGLVEPDNNLPVTDIDLSGIKVLIVDDDADSLEVCCVGLDRFGAETRRATSGPAALEIMRRWRPDVLISDLGMPGEDGFDLIGKIRSIEATEGHRLPAAALTAYAGDEFRVQALDAGFDVHLAKPIDSDDLAEAVMRLGSHSRNGGPPLPRPD